MKKKLFLLSFALLSAAKPLLAQFYTVEKISVPIRVISAAEKRPSTDNGTVRENTAVSADTTALSDRRQVLRRRLLLSCPLESDSLYVTSPYGYRNDPFTKKRKFHAGTDYRAAGDNVYAMMPGRIRSVGYRKGLGNYVELEHGDYVVTYGHLHTTVGKKGDEVKAGQSVGISGSTGRSTAEHLHLSMSYKGKRLDPHPIVTYICRQIRLLDREIASLSDSNVK
jgi:murein DD-endopeptidase MepM/ murein hydrolase activator NlpD